MSSRHDAAMDGFLDGCFGSAKRRPEFNAGAYARGYLEGCKARVDEANHLEALAKTWEAEDRAEAREQ